MGIRTTIYFSLGIVVLGLLVTALYEPFTGRVFLKSQAQLFAEGLIYIIASLWLFYLAGRLRAKGKR